MVLKGPAKQRVFGAGKKLGFSNFSHMYVHNIGEMLQTFINIRFGGLHTHERVYPKARIPKSASTEKRIIPKSTT
jgi:hypothetical protein